MMLSGANTDGWWTSATATTATTAADTWSYWNVQWIEAATPTYATTWASWNTDSFDTATTITTTACWAYWNGQHWQRETGTAPQPARPAQPAEIAMARNGMTPEQYQEHRRLQAERDAANQARLAAELAERQAADVRAKELLVAVLSETQKAEFEKNETFTVISKDGERRYRVKKGWSHNVERIDVAGKKLHTLCAHPSQTVPEYDNMIAQLLFLEHSEDEFLKVANRGA